MPNYLGTRLMSGQQWSDKYPNHIDVGGGSYRQPFMYRGRWVNRYKVEMACTHCGKLYLQDRANNRKGNKPFCTKECKSAYLNTQSRGREIRKKRDHGHHVLVYMHDHPRADKKGMVFQHILVAEDVVGRSIKKHEVVHHINCVKNDNSRENLFVCENTSEHHRIHGSLNRCVEALLQSGAIVFDAEKKEYRIA